MGRPMRKVKGFSQFGHPKDAFLTIILGAPGAHVFQHGRRRYPLLRNSTFDQSGVVEPVLTEKLQPECN